MQHLETELIMYPRKRPFVIMLIVALALIVFGVYQVNDYELYVGWGAILAGVLLGGFSIQFMIPGMSYLKLTEKGFEIKNMGKAELTEWKDVQPFVVGSMHKRVKMVCFDYKPEYEERKKIRAFNQVNFGIEGALGTAYGESPEALAEMMNIWRIGYTKSDSENINILE